MKTIETRKRYLMTAAALLAAFITFLVYRQSLKCGFVNWDDPQYVYENPYIRSLDLNFLKWVFTADYFYNWHPLTLITYSIDFLILGFNPFQYHLTNIIIHSFNTYLVFFLTLRLAGLARGAGTNQVTLKDAAASLITALLFGLHPLHVESVTWISERKDVLCALFFISSVMAYLRYAEARKISFYFISLSLFVLALMSKAMAVTLPAVLLILDFYPLKRLPGDFKKAVVEKLPFFMLSAAASFAAIWAQKSGGSLASLEIYSLAERVAVAVKAAGFYLYKMILPFNLVPYYPMPLKTEFFGSSFIISLVIFVAITVFCLAMAKRNAFFLAVWLYFLATFLPISGLMQVGSQAAADRYMYIPSIGVFMLTGLGLASAFNIIEKKRLMEAMAVIIISSSFVILGYLTVRQQGIWTNSFTLWDAALREFPGSQLPHFKRAEAYKSAGSPAMAVADFTRAIELDPGLMEGYVNRGVAYETVGDFKKAIEDYDTVLRLAASSAVSFHDRGDKAAEGISAGSAPTLDVKLAIVYYNRGVAYGKSGDTQRAIEDYTRALSLVSGFVQAYSRRGDAHIKQGEYAKAVEDFKKAVSLNPAKAEAYYALGMAYSKMGDAEQAKINGDIADKLSAR